MEIQIKNIADLGYYYRGIIIHHAIWIENLIDEIFISYYLDLGNTLIYEPFQHNEEAEEFRHTILSQGNFNFDFKFNAVTFLFNKHCKELYDKYTSDGFDEDAKKIKEIRNHFAHRKFLLSESNWEKQEIILIHKTTERKKIKPDKIPMNPVLLEDFMNRFLRVYKGVYRMGQNLLEKKRYQ